MMNSRLILGAVVAPLAAPFVFCILIAGNIFISVHEFLQAMIPVSAFAIPIAYIVELFIGWPVFFVLKKLNKVTAFNVIILATLLLPIIMLLVSIVNGAEFSTLVKNSFKAYLAIGICGLVVSSLFWVIGFGFRSRASR